MRHEDFIEAVRRIVVTHVQDAAQRSRLESTKLTYGVGSSGVRGACYYSAWKNGESHDFIEISASGEESAIQLAGTTIHELGHVLAGNGAGHGPDWKLAARVLGLSDPSAASQVYAADSFDLAIRAAIEALGEPTDGSPQLQTRGASGLGLFIGLPLRKLRACPLGRGTRGGTSTGPGSCRLLKAMCGGCGYVIRLTRIWADKGLPICPCGTTFELVSTVTLSGKEKR